MKTTLQKLGYSRRDRRVFGLFCRERGGCIAFSHDGAIDRSSLSGVRSAMAYQTFVRAERDKRGVKFLPSQVERRAFANSRI